MLRIGRYEVEREIGQGSMGVVYLALDPLLRRQVAVKTVVLMLGLSPEDEREFKTRFLREAQAAGVLTHPAIVTIYDAGEDDGRGLPFIAMEYVRGRSLKEFLAEQGALAPARALEIAGTLAGALHHAHAAGIVHRDIKPANILVRDGDGAPKIADFGIARFATSELTASGKSFGSPAWMSPEQFRRGPVDGRSDLFSLAAVLYQMLCGERPFAGEDLSSLAYSIVHETPAPLSGRRAALPVGIDAFFERALAKDPGARFQDGASLQDALARLIEEPAMAPGAELRSRDAAAAAASPGGDAGASLRPAAGMELRAASPSSEAQTETGTGESAVRAAVAETRAGVSAVRAAVEEAGAGATAISAAEREVGTASSDNGARTEATAAPLAAAPGPTEALIRSASGLGEASRRTYEALVAAAREEWIPAARSASLRAARRSEKLASAARARWVPAARSAGARLAARIAGRAVEPSRTGARETRRIDLSAFLKRPSRRTLVIAAAVAVLLLVPGFALFYHSREAWLLLEARSSVRSGSLTLRIDGREVYSHRLAAPDPGEHAFFKKLLGRNQESFQARIGLRPGHHEIEAQVVAEGEGSEYSGSTEIEIAPGESRKIELIAGRSYGTPLSIEAD